MKNRIYLIAIVILLSTACSLLQTVKLSWSKPGAQPGEYERVKVKCQQDPGLTGLGDDASFEVCMKRKGWFLIEETVQ